VQTMSPLPPPVQDDKYPHCFSPPPPVHIPPPPNVLQMTLPTSPHGCETGFLLPGTTLTEALFTHLIPHNRLTGPFQSKWGTFSFFIGVPKVTFPPPSHLNFGPLPCFSPFRGCMGVNENFPPYISLVFFLQFGWASSHEAFFDSFLIVLFPGQGRYFFFFFFCLPVSWGVLQAQSFPLPSFPHCPFWWFLFLLCFRPLSFFPIRCLLRSFVLVAIFFFCSPRFSFCFVYFVVLKQVELRTKKDFSFDGWCGLVSHPCFTPPAVSIFFFYLAAHVCFFLNMNRAPYCLTPLFPTGCDLPSFFVYFPYLFQVLNL